MTGKKNPPERKPKTASVLSTPLAQDASGKKAPQWAAVAPSCPSDGLPNPSGGPSPPAADLVQGSVCQVRDLMGPELGRGGFLPSKAEFQIPKLGMCCVYLLK